MTQRRSVAHHVVVNAPIERAFAVFTERFGDFKPREHNLLAVPIAETVFEPRVGGHIYDRGVDGSVCRWARILVYEPPRRVMFTWDIGPTWQRETDESKTSEVEVRFTAESDERTRVDLEHRHLERHGAGWESVADAVDGDAGWPLYLDRYDGLLSTEFSEMTATLMTMAHHERADLAEFLATLTPRDWEAPSLCTKWSVKDVVAHVISYEELGTLGLVKRFAKGWIVRTNQVGVDEFAALSPQQLLEFLRNHLQPHGLTAGFGGMIALVDGTIHHQDIRRALGRPRTVPVDRLERVLGLVPGNPRLGAGRRIRGLRLRATDIDWAHGRGPEVTGPGEALLMAMSGRPAALADLRGPGLDTLARRLGG
jgi:uncharacterized protein (TIGR03083 family)